MFPTIKEASQERLVVSPSYWFRNRLEYLHFLCGREDKRRQWYNSDRIVIIGWLTNGYETAWDYLLQVCPLSNLEIYVFITHLNCVYYGILCTLCT